MNYFAERLNNANARLIIEADSHENNLDICLVCDIEILVNDKLEYIKTLRANDLDELKALLIDEFY